MDAIGAIVNGVIYNVMIQVANETRTKWDQRQDRDQGVQDRDRFSTQSHFRWCVLETKHCNASETWYMYCPMYCLLTPSVRHSNIGNPLVYGVLFCYSQRYLVVGLVGLEIPLTVTVRFSRVRLNTLISSTWKTRR